MWRGYPSLLASQRQFGSRGDREPSTVLIVDMLEDAWKSADGWIMWPCRHNVWEIA